MMKRIFLGTGFAAALAMTAWAAGCGGNVVVDPGAGGAGPGGSGPGTGPGTTTSSTGTGVDPQSQCQELCQLQNQLGCGSGPLQECVAGCVDLFAAAPQCNADLSNFIGCLLAQQAGCEVPTACIGAFDAFQQCANEVTCSGQVECFGGSDGSCGCKGFCQGQDVAVECVPQGGAVFCDCFSNGNLVGSCQEFNDSCSIQSGCCAPLLFGVDEG